VTVPTPPEPEGHGPAHTAVTASGDRAVSAMEITNSVVHTGDIVNVTVLPQLQTDEQDAAAAELAKLVRRRLAAEEDKLQMSAPVRLPVLWQAAPLELTAQWAAIRKVPLTDPAEPLDLTNGRGDLCAVYERIPSHRLVLLGPGGSGKSVLTQRFALDLLAKQKEDGTREHTRAVPVVFSIGSWNPTVPLKKWMTRQLLRDHAGLAAPMAAELVEDRRILPILDGFDEIAGELRLKALAELSRTSDLPLLLTSRRKEYEDAVARTGPLSCAAAVELLGLPLDKATAYLSRANERAWDPVLDELRQRPGSPASTSLTEVLSTPLMVGIARTVYSGGSGRRSSELLKEPLLSAGALENHLLDRFVPTVYARPDDPSRWDPERAQHVLGYLADHLRRRGNSRELAWWEIGAALGRIQRVLVVGLVVGLTFAVTDSLMAATVLLWTGMGVPFPFALELIGARATVVGAAFALIHTLRLRLGAVEPSRVRLRIRGASWHKPQQVRKAFALRFRDGLVLGAAGGFVGLGGLVASDGIIFDLWDRLPGGLVNALLAGFVAGLVGTLACVLLLSLTMALLAWLEAPIRTEAAEGPLALLNANRTTVLAQFLVTGLVSGIALGTVNGLLQGAAQGVEFGIVAGTVIAVGGALALTAWGQWVVFGRIWLPLTGQLPWAAAAFLKDAHERGVLRQVGAVYQFRHARLQDRLVHGVRVRHNLSRPHTGRRPADPTPMP